MGKNKKAYCRYHGKHDHDQCWDLGAQKSNRDTHPRSPPKKIREDKGKGLQRALNKGREVRRARKARL